jgi:hypothetical protein
MATRASWPYWRARKTSQVRGENCPQERRYRQRYPPSLGSVTGPATETPLEEVLRACGASMAERNGRTVAAHFGSAASEAAVCQRTVGLTVRFGRVTLDVRGGPRQLDAALLALDQLGERAWWTRTSPRAALVRCEPDDLPTCEALLRHDDLSVDHESRVAALGLVGPRAGDVLGAAALEGASFPAVVLADPQGIEILVPRAEGAAAWWHLLRAGTRFQIACVGFDALQHLSASRARSRSVSARYSPWPRLAGP